MRNLLVFIPLFLIFFIGAGYQEATLNYSLLVKRSGYYYDKREKLPFTGKAVSTHHNGKPAQSYSVVKGVPDGPFIQYTDKGNVIRRGSWQPVWLKLYDGNPLNFAHRINIETMEAPARPASNAFVVLRFPLDYKKQEVIVTAAKRYLDSLYPNNKIEQVIAVEDELVIREDM